MFFCIDVCKRVWRHTGLQCARIAYNETRNFVNNLIKRTKIQYYMHKLEDADNKDMLGIVNSLPRVCLLLHRVIKPLSSIVLHVTCHM